MAIVQSVLLVVAIGLVIFSKSPYSTLRSSKTTYLALESPSASPPSIRKSRGRDDGGSPLQGGRYISHQRQVSDISLPEYDYSSPIADESFVSESAEEENKTRFIAIQSSPATPSGLHSASTQVSWAGGIDEAFGDPSLNAVHDQAKRWSVPDIRHEYIDETEADDLLDPGQTSVDINRGSISEESTQSKSDDLDENIEVQFLNLPGINERRDSDTSLEGVSELPVLLRTSTR